MVYKKFIDELRAAGIIEPERELSELICFAYGIDKTTLYREGVDFLEHADINRLKAYVQMRKKRQPLQYIVGEVEFYGLTLKVSTGVLIPRPETELMVHEAALYLQNKPLRKALDLCTGSGCIALSLAKHFPNARFYATDISQMAISSSILNKQVNNVQNVYFLLGNLFSPLKPAVFDLIISNPPYIKTVDISNLQPEIRIYEPTEALDGGKDGLDYYKKIIEGASNGFLSPDGILILEIGTGQADDILDIAVSYGFKHIYFKKDYSGIERIAFIS